MIEKNNLFGIVVWYNPTKKNIDSTDSYINDVKQLIIVDNSVTDNSFLIQEKEWQNVIYQPNYKNKGIATALNQGCNLAIEHGAEWILTMDQDSFFDSNGVKSLINKANAYTNFNNTAIFSARHYIEDEKRKKRKQKAEYTLENAVMTSGNLLSLNAYKTTGKFADDFFIDLVDIEYCIRLKKQNYIIVMINDIILHHFMGGGTIERTFLGFKKSFYNHAPVRKYYIARNSLYIGKRHKELRHKYRKHLLKQLKKIILYDNCHKGEKLLYMLKGILDYQKGIIGEYHPNKI